MGRKTVDHPRPGSKLFSKQLLLLSDDFGGLMIDWNDLLSIADLGASVSGDLFAVLISSP